METAKKIVSEYEKHQNEGLYQSVMELIVSANSETFREAKSMCQALKEFACQAIGSSVESYEEAKKLLEE